MFCNNCGNPIDDYATQCPYCGAPQGGGYRRDDDKGGFLWGLLGCCIPLVGLILFLIWKDTKPNTAKAVGMGALISVGITVVYYFIMIVLGVGMSFM